MSDRYTEVITDHTLSCAISPGDGTIHDSRKGWGTYSPDGKSITWDSWRPLTQAEIDAENERRTKLNEWHRSPEGRAFHEKTERFIDDLFARNGTSRAEVAKALLDVIAKAPPLTPCPPSNPAPA